jgi:hypothetical protein
MSDNNLDIRARLTGEDRLSPTVVKLLAKIKSLEEQMKKLGKAGSSIDVIPMEKYVQAANKAGRSLNGLTKKHYDWAKANGVQTDKAALGWGKLTNRIIELKEQHEAYVNSHKRGHATMAKNIEKQLRNEYKNAVAYRYLYNKTNDERVGMQRRVTEQLSNLEATHLRNEEKRHRAHLGNISRMRSDALRSMRSMGNLGNRAIPYAAAAAGATGYAGVSAFRTRMKTDTAETNMRMFGDMSQDDVRAWRKSFGNRSAIKYGMKPDEMINAQTEVIKAGIPKEKANSVTETILKAGAGLDLDLKETTRFATRLATLTQDMSNLDPEKLKKMLNSVAIAGIATAADPNEIIAANRRASGAFASSKMSPNDLSAFTSAGISAGMPSSKTGTFLGFLVNELVGGKFAKGQRAQDLNKASNLLGMGGRQNMSAKMAADPTNTMMSIFEKMGGMNEQKQAQVATLLGMREWRDELQTFVQVRDDIARTLKEINDPKKQAEIDRISDSKLKSLAGRWKSLVSAFTLVWESVGAGLEKAFGQVSEFFTDYLGNFDTSKITNTVEAFTDGIVAGLGFSSWSDMLKAAFGDPGTVKEYSKEVFGFVKGFMTQMKEMWTTASAIFSGLMKAAGVNTADPEAIGRFTGKLVELGVALKGIGMLGEALAGITTFVKGLAGLASMFLSIPGLATLGAVFNNLGVSSSAQKQSGETTSEWRERQQKLKELRTYKTPSGADPLFQPSSYTGATDFSGRRRSSDLSDNLNKFTGKVERAAFINSGGLGGGLQYAAMGGSGRGLSGGGGGGGGLGGMIGGIPSLLNSTPGSALPDIGVGRSGAIIGRDRVGALTGASKVPSIGGAPGSAAADMTAGQGLSGNAFLAARRARFGEELNNDPNLRLHLAAMQATEGASRGGTIESLMNRSDMQGKSMRQMLGYSADGQINPRSFYGPIRRGELGPTIARLKRDPAEFAKYDALTNRALAGSHIIGGYTDQGLPTDPNGSARTGIPGLRLKDPRTGKTDGNEFTDWVGPGSSFGRGRNGAINYRKFLENGINGSGDSPIGAVPSPSEAIKNVPMGPAATPGVGAGDIRSSGGPVAIHINGSSHDPEALATLVQRRVDESMNWRTHDTASEYS